jgi:hypothetical protein
MSGVNASWYMQILWGWARLLRVVIEPTSVSFKQFRIWLNLISIDTNFLSYKLQTSVASLCKSVVFENTRCEHNDYTGRLHHLFYQWPYLRKTVLRTCTHVLLCRFR